FEFQERTDVARFKVTWDQGTGTWVVPTGALRANQGLVTTKTGPKLQTTYSFPTNDLIARRLQASETTTDLATGESRTTTYDTYDDYGRALQTTAAAGTPVAATTVNTFSGACMTQTTDPAGAAVETVCDAAGNPTQITQHIRAVGPQPAHDRVTTKAYDDAGRQTLEDPPGPAKTTTIYDEAGRPETVTTVVSESGTPSDPTDDVVATTTYEYDAQGRLFKEHLPDPDGAGPEQSPTVTHLYDPVGNEIERIDERGNSWLTQYDAAGRVIGTTSPSGLQTATVYKLLDGSGGYLNEVRATSTDGVTTVTTMDVLGRVISEKVGSLDPTTNTYDVLGNVIRTTDPAGVWVEQDYSAFGDVTEERSLSPAPGNPVATTTRAYDARGRVTWADGPRAGTGDRVSFTYDAVGNITSATQEGVPSPNTTTAVYDDAGEHVSVTTPGDTPITREWIFDETGQVETFRDIRDAATTYETHTSYNGLGLPVTVDDPRGLTLRFDYDRQGRETRRWAETGGTESAAIASTYDPAGNVLTATVESSGLTTSYTYGTDGRAKTVSQDGETTTYAFEPATGRVASVTDAAGTTSLTYTQDGLLSTITDPLSGLPTTYSYDSAGRATSRTDPAGLTWSRTYDPSGAIATQQALAGAAPVFTLAMTYDVAGAPTEKDVFVDGAPSTENGVWAYGYDGAGRMTSVTDPGGEETTYTYDGAGNRTQVKVGTSPAEITTYDQAGLPTSATGGTTYTHDEAGNLTSVTTADQTWTYAYDAWGRLIRAEGGPLGEPLHTRDYTHDAAGRTATATEGLTEAAYTYSGEGEDLARVSTSTGGVPGTETLLASGPGGPLAQETTQGVSFFLRDLHGDVVGLAAAGATTGTAFYDAWGEPREQTGEISVLGFQGDLTDPTTGLVDMGARLYAPSLGRFTTRDVLFGDLANPISLNQYVYGATSPVLNTDDLGLCANPSVCPAPSGSSSSQKKKWYSTGAAISPPPSYYGGMSYTPSATSGQQIRHEPPRPDVGPKVGARKFTTRDPDIARAGKWMAPIETSTADSNPGSGMDSYTSGGSQLDPYGNKYGTSTTRTEAWRARFRLGKLSPGIIEGFRNALREGDPFADDPWSTTNQSFKVSGGVITMGYSTKGGLSLGFGWGTPGFSYSMDKSGSLALSLPEELPAGVVVLHSARESRGPESVDATTAGPSDWAIRRRDGGSNGTR
ncbi:MAG TPA: RHS repeat-associated core domain-containing protein, partial [Longimicrobiales bacterium]|nr:RHS repeat-associated core domain-containing protein [Longimicrobiales bacterium]